MERKSCRPPDPVLTSPATQNGPVAVPEEVFVRAFGAASAGLRARILNRLLGSVGTLASAVLGGGIFLRIVAQMRHISPEDAANVTATQFLDLVSYVEQSNPGAFAQAVQLLLQDPSVLTAIGVTLAAATTYALGRSAEGGGHPMTSSARSATIRRPGTASGRNPS